MDFEDALEIVTRVLANLGEKDSVELICRVVEDFDLPFDKRPEPEE